MSVHFVPLTLLQGSGSWQAFSRCSKVVLSRSVLVSVLLLTVARSSSASERRM